MRTTAIWTGVALALVGTIPVAGMAAGTENDLDYTYLQLNGIARDIKPVNKDSSLVKRFDNGSGYGLNGSFQFLPKYFVFGDYSDTKSDVTYTSPTTFALPADTHIKRVDVGVGTDRPITDRLDIIGRAAYTDVDYGKFKIGSGGGLFSGGGLSGLRSRLASDTSDGYVADVAVRGLLSPSLQGTVGVRHLDIGTIKTNDIIGNLLYQFSRNWGVDLNVDAGSDISTYMLGVRFTPG